MRKGKEFDFSDDEYHIASTKPEDTEEVWSKILMLCEKEYHIGFGLLDSFLSGPDLEKRIELVENEIKRNNWLRSELLDTISCNDVEMPSMNPSNEEIISALGKIL